MLSTFAVRLGQGTKQNNNRVMIILRIRITTFSFYLCYLLDGWFVSRFTQEPLKGFPQNLSQNRVSTQNRPC